MDSNNMNDYTAETAETTETTEAYEYSYDENAEAEISEGGNGLGIACIILGGLSLLCCAVPGLPTVLGIVGLILAINARKKCSNKTLGLIGLIVSIVGIVISLGSLIGGLFIGGGSLISVIMALLENM